MNSYSTTNQQNSIISRIPIKIVYGEQIRRFTIDVISFSKLESDIRVIFNWNKDLKFDVKYVDDEGDLILISSDEELKAATELFKDPQAALRLILEKKEPEEIMKKGNELTSQTKQQEQHKNEESIQKSTTTTTTNLPLTPPLDPSTTIELMPQQYQYQYHPSNFDWRQKKFEKKEWKSHRKIEKDLEKDYLKDIKKEHKEFKRSHHHHHYHHHHPRGFHFDQQEGGRIPRNFIARLVKHVTCDDGMEYSPNVDFEKIWRIRNDGSQIWPKGTKFLRVSMRFGNELNAPEFIELNEEVQPGGIIDIKVPMKTPSKEGCYENYWKMQLTTDGQKFGQRFRCQLKVATISSDESSNEEKKKNIIIPVENNNNNNNNNKNNNYINTTNDIDNCEKKEKKFYRLNFDELEKKWNVQLMLLETLGFKKRKGLIKLIEKFQGNVNKVLNVIISLKQRDCGVIQHNNTNETTTTTTTTNVNQN